MSDYEQTLRTVAKRIGIAARDVSGSLCDLCGRRMDIVHGRLRCACGFVDTVD